MSFVKVNHNKKISLLSNHLARWYGKNKNCLVNYFSTSWVLFLSMLKLNWKQNKIKNNRQTKKRKDKPRIEKTPFSRFQNSSVSMNNKYIQCKTLMYIAISYLIFLLQNVSWNADSVYNAMFQIHRFKLSVPVITLDVFQQFFLWNRKLVSQYLIDSSSQRAGSR